MLPASLPVRTMKILLPEKIPQLFINEAKANFDTSGKLVETLCYFFGHVETNQENDKENHIIDVLLLPKQKGTASYVTDNGK